MEDTSLWSKKQEEMTVGDSMKVMGVAMAVSVIAPVILAGVAYGAISAYEKLQQKRADRKSKKDEL